ncbi:MAG: hypothetical protein APF77_08180 [Clostridia bacterium BRH_c25]|nr:MAG: hypothetical protein APF77_08180 [Clostridia bacterium BRH_c25]
MDDSRAKMYYLLIILLCITFVFIGCTQETAGHAGEKSAEEQPAADDRLKYRMDTDHFKYYSYDNDADVLGELGKELEAEFDGITSRLQYVPQEKIDVEIYPDVDTFHTCMGYPDSPDWLVGYAGNGKVQMVSPNNPGPVHSYESLMKAVVHEFTHIIIRGHNKGAIPIWLNEGIASYEAQNIEYIKEAISGEVKYKHVPSFTELDQKNFAERHGYQYSITIVEFLVKTYDYDRLVEMIKNPDIEKVYGVTEEELHKKWVLYLEENYQ